ncbi:hypothetical protein MBLNU459_g7287t1 [Dothideomycetes sp. NU459]
MTEKDISELSEHRERASDYELQTVNTNGTVSTGPDPTEAPNFKFGFNGSVVFLGLLLGFFSDNLLVACISSVLTKVNEDLGPSISYVWIISAIYTTVSITAPFVGRLGDIFGRKYLLIIGNILGGIGCIVSATGQTMTALIVGATLLGFGSSLDLLAWAAVGIDTRVASCTLLVLTGFGISSLTVVTNCMIQLSVPHQYLGVAMGLVTTFRYVGGSVGSTIYEVILTNQLTSNLGPNIATALAKVGVPLVDIPAIAQALATGNTTSTALVDASPAAIGAGVHALQLTYVHAFKIIFLVSIAFGVLGSVCAAFTRNVGEFLTNKLDVQLDQTIHLGLHEVHEGGHVVDHDGTEIK